MKIIRPQIFLVLGGPGCGKGTQCSLIQRQFPIKHLSAGHLLRTEQERNSPFSQEIKECIQEGKIVRSYITVKLLENQINEFFDKKICQSFLIDGFPRNKENLMSLLDVKNFDIKFLMYIKCSEEIMLERILSRKEGRIDDDIDVFKKRIRLFQNETMEIINYFKLLNLVKEINGDKTQEEVFQQIKPIFQEI